MNKDRITIGELAKSLNISVRTLQYYDKIGLLKPSETTEGGRRIYKSEDISTLHQIISLKALGFSLGDIKDKLILVKDTNDVMSLLERQEGMIVNQIEKQQRILESIEVLKSEIKIKNEVDWYKYSNMVNLIQQNNEYYWVVKHLDNKLIDHMLDKKSSNEEVSPGWWKEIFDRAIVLEEGGVTPESLEGQALAERWWSNMQKFSGGNSEMLTKMVDFYYSAEQWPKEFREVKHGASKFVEKAFLYYLEKNKIEIIGRK